MSGGNFTYLVQIVAFLAAIWFAGRVCRRLHVSPIIGEIFAGVIMGPEVLNIVPEVTRHDEDSEWDSLWQVMGTAGVTLMIAESGTHIHFDKLKKVGMSALAVAILGTFVPLFIGGGFAYLFDTVHTDMNAAFAAGCALAPTSVGIALKLLTEAKQLNSFAGQTIVTAAFLDDVFSIILLVVLEGIASTIHGSGSFGAVDIILSSIYCFLFLGIGMLLSIHVFAHYIPKLLSAVPLYFSLNYQPRDEIHLMLMLGILVSYGLIGNLIGSHLLGAFIAGMSFSQVSRSMYVWRRQIKRIAGWLVRFFFACTVAFTIPIEQLLDPNAFWKGVVFALIPTVLGKLIAGFAAWKYRYIVGFAMVGRGEFAYLVAQIAKSEGLINDELYAIIVWALLLAVLIAPIAFRKVLSKAFENQTKSGIQYFKILAEGQHHCGIHFEIVDALHNLKLDILEAKVETDGDIDASHFVVGVGEDGDLDEDKIEEILHDLRESLADPQSQVQLQPCDERDIGSLLQARQMAKEKMSHHYGITNNNNNNHTNHNNNGGIQQSTSLHLPSHEQVGYGVVKSVNVTTAVPSKNANSSSTSIDTSPDRIPMVNNNKNDGRNDIIDSNGGNNSAINKNMKKHVSSKSTFSFRNIGHSMKNVFSKSFTGLPGVNNYDNNDHHLLVASQNDFSNVVNTNNNKGHHLSVSGNGPAFMHLGLSDQSSNSNMSNASNGNGHVKSLISYLDDKHWLEVKLMTTHAPHLFVEIVNTLENLGITLVKGHMTDFLNVEEEVFYGRGGTIGQSEKCTVDNTAVKSSLQAVLNSHGIKSIPMVKPVRKIMVVLPDIPKMSDLLTAAKAHNPLLSHAEDDIEDQCGYEIDLDCEHRPKLLQSVNFVFETMDLDIRAANVENDFDKLRWKGCFFVRESKKGEFSPHIRRKLIETNLIQVFQTKNMAAKIKIKAIEVGKAPTMSPIQQQSPQNPQYPQNTLSPFDSHSQFKQIQPITNNNSNNIATSSRGVNTEIEESKTVYVEHAQPQNTEKSNARVGVTVFDPIHEHDDENEDTGLALDNRENDDDEEDDDEFDNNELIPPETPREEESSVTQSLGMGTIDDQFRQFERKHRDSLLGSTLGNSVLLVNPMLPQISAPSDNDDDNDNDNDDLYDISGRPAPLVITQSSHDSININTQTVSPLINPRESSIVVDMTNLNNNNNIVSPLPNKNSRSLVGTNSNKLITPQDKIKSNRNRNHNNGTSTSISASIGSSGNSSLKVKHAKITESVALVTPSKQKRATITRTPTAFNLITLMSDSKQNIHQIHHSSFSPENLNENNNGNINNNNNQNNLTNNDSNSILMPTVRRVASLPQSQPTAITQTHSVHTFRADPISSKSLKTSKSNTESPSPLANIPKTNMQRAVSAQITPSHVINNNNSLLEAKSDPVIHTEDDLSAMFSNAHIAKIQEASLDRKTRHSDTDLVTTHHDYHHGLKQRYVSNALQQQIDMNQKLPNLKNDEENNSNNNNNNKTGVIGISGKSLVNRIFTNKSNSNSPQTNKTKPFHYKRRQDQSKSVAVTATANGSFPESAKDNNNNNNNGNKNDKNKLNNTGRMSIPSRSVTPQPSQAIQPLPIIRPASASHTLYDESNDEHEHGHLHEHGFHQIDTDLSNVTEQDEFVIQGDTEDQTTNDTNDSNNSNRENDSENDNENSGGFMD